MKTEIISRYTNLPSLLDILHTKEISLLSPDSWEDKNDSYYLKEYQRRKDIGSLLALCFSAQSETFHHWKVFSAGSSGVRIEFKKKDLLKSIKKQIKIRNRVVTYLKINDCKAMEPLVSDLPFLKRNPYKDEKEFRILWEDQEENLKSKRIHIKISDINKIVLSPWLHKSMRGSLVKVIKNIRGCSKLVVNRSTLIDNQKWKNITNHLT